MLYYVPMTYVLYLKKIFIFIIYLCQIYNISVKTPFLNSRAVRPLTFFFKSSTIRLKSAQFDVSPKMRYNWSFIFNTGNSSRYYNLKI